MFGRLGGEKGVVSAARDVAVDSATGGPEPTGPQPAAPAASIPNAHVTRPPSRSIGLTIVAAPFRRATKNAKSAIFDCAQLRRRDHERKKRGIAISLSRK